MTRLFALHDAMFGQIESRLAWLSPTLARLVFAGVLLVYFWNSARTKLGDGPLGHSDGMDAKPGGVEVDIPATLRTRSERLPSHRTQKVFPTSV